MFTEVLQRDNEKLKRELEELEELFKKGGRQQKQQQGGGASSSNKPQGRGGKQGGKQRQDDKPANVPCGRTATAGLRKLDDGQNDSVAMLHRKLKDEESSALHGKWDTTPYKYDAPRPVVPKDHSSVPLRAGSAEGYNPGHEERVMSNLKPKHHAMIEQMMQAYRNEATSLAPTTVRDPTTGTMRTVRPSATGRQTRNERVRPPQKKTSPQEVARKARAATDATTIAHAEAIAKAKKVGIAH
mmetsp:Transcript_75309/g.149515  ORF Transcript_75309/g.149515 Transcript_75309/m.149515 type:complete len:242 (-) Transcript_75309:113-838(-)